MSILPILQTCHPILRQTAKLLSAEEIKSSFIQDLIKDMQETLRSAPGVGLAAPQIGHSLSIVVIEDLEEYHSNLTSEELQQRERKPTPFHVLINPKLSPITETKIEFYEGCLSVENMLGIVPRFHKVRVACLNELGERVVIHAEGWYARILQHEIDHLQGMLNLDHMFIQSLTTIDNYNQFWRAKDISEIKKLLLNKRVSMCMAF